MQESNIENKYILRFPTETGVQSIALASFDMPKLNIERIEIPHSVPPMFVTSRYTWQKQNIVIFDHFSPIIYDYFISWFKFNTYMSSTRIGHCVGALVKTFLIDNIKNDEVYHTWIMENCALVDDIKINDSSNDDRIELSFTIQPQKCELLF